MSTKQQKASAAYEAAKLRVAALACSLSAELRRASEINKHCPAGLASVFVQAMEKTSLVNLLRDVLPMSANYCGEVMGFLCYDSQNDLVDTFPATAKEFGKGFTRTHAAASVGQYKTNGRVAKADAKTALRDFSTSLLSSPAPIIGRQYSTRQSAARAIKRAGLTTASVNQLDAGCFEVV